MKIFYLILTMLISFSAFAEPGVIIQASGKVTIIEAGKKKTAITGSKFADGSTIEVSKGAKATLMFSNGAMKPLSSGEKFIAKAQGKTKKDQSIIKGLSLAYNDATRASAGPTVHGMVKAAPKGKVQDAKLSVTKEKQLKADLDQINKMNLDKDGKALMHAQLYYTYKQYKKSVDLLLPIHKTQNPPSEMIKGLLAASYEKMGELDEAEKYKN